MLAHHFSHYYTREDGDGWWQNWLVWSAPRPAFPAAYFLRELEYLFRELEYQEKHGNVLTPLFSQGPKLGAHESQKCHVL